MKKKIEKQKQNEQLQQAEALERDAAPGWAASHEPEDAVEPAKAQQLSALVTDAPAEDLVISVRNLFKIFRLGEERVRALDGVSFDIRRGEFCSIVGASGSGKSTLLNMLAGLEPPSLGAIRIQGHNIVGLSEDELVAFRRDHVGFIFQSFNLIPSMNALENVALPLVFRGEAKAVRTKKARLLLHMMGLDKQIYHRPYEMSGGQQQRVGIARALVVNPRIIFADEPTGNLDSHTSREIMDLIQEISKKHQQTLIMVTHDDHLAQYGDRIFRIQDGRIISVERGSLCYQGDEKSDAAAAEPADKLQLEKAENPQPEA